MKTKTMWMVAAAVGAWWVFLRGLPEYPGTGLTLWKKMQGFAP
jgi:hypothetical protein